MTELTDEEAKALLAECDNPDCLTCEYARALLDARAELARVKADRDTLAAANAALEAKVTGLRQILLVTVNVLNAEKNRQGGEPFTGRWAMPGINFSGTVDEAIEQAVAALATQEAGTC